MYKMTPDEQKEYHRLCDEFHWTQRFYKGVKFNKVYQKYVPTFWFSELWEEFKDLYEPPCTK